MEQQIGVPTFGGIKESAISYAWGLGSGIIYRVGSSIFGSGFIGGLIAAAITGATVKGAKGEMLATMLGFMSIAGLNESPAPAANDNNAAMTVV